MLYRLSYPHRARVFSLEGSNPAFTVPRFGFTGFPNLTVYSFRRQQSFSISVFTGSRFALHFPILTGPVFGFSRQQSLSIPSFIGPRFALQASLSLHSPSVLLQKAAIREHSCFYRAKVCFTGFLILTVPEFIFRRQQYCFYRARFA